MQHGLDSRQRASRQGVTVKSTSHVDAVWLCCGVGMKRTTFAPRPHQLPALFRSPWQPMGAAGPVLCVKLQLELGLLQKMSNGAFAVTVRGITVT